MAAPSPIVLHGVGDIMLAGIWTADLRKAGYGSHFDGVRQVLYQGDLNIGNMECPIATGGEEFVGKKFRFRAEPEVAAAVRQAGFNVVTLANNHIMDFGAGALRETIANLDATGMLHVGAGENLGQARRAVVVEVKGKRVAFLGYSLTQPIEFFATDTTPGTAPAYEPIVLADVAAIRPLADYVVVSIHWGTEALSETQPHLRVLGKKIIEAGADIILGHHPHVLRGIERHKGGIIFYSLGNFVFASKSTIADVSAIVRITLHPDGRKEAEVLPVDVFNPRVGFTPQMLKGEAAQAVVQRLNTLSQPFGTQIQRAEGRYVIPF